MHKFDVMTEEANKAIFHLFPELCRAADFVRKMPRVWFGRINWGLRNYRLS